MSRPTLAELLRQDALDLFAPPPPPPCLIPPRLLILACSAAKATAPGLAARDRYQGPLWQTLRAADPDGSRAFVCFLSAKFGLGDARAELEHYDRVLTDADADRMVEAGACEPYPLRPPVRHKTKAGQERAMLAQQGERLSPNGALIRLVRELGRPIREVAICGGHRYVRVASSWLPDCRNMGLVARSAPVTVINDQIGHMRAQLRAWIEAPGAGKTP